MSYRGVLSRIFLVCESILTLDKLNVKSMVCVMCVCVPRDKGWMLNINYDPPTNPLAHMSPIGFPLVQCEGELEHWLVPPDWRWGRHPFPHQLALEVHPGWLRLTPNVTRHVAIQLDLPNASEQCFLKCSSERVPVHYCPHLISLTVWVLGWCFRTSALSFESADITSWSSSSPPTPLPLLRTITSFPMHMLLCSV